MFDVIFFNDTAQFATKTRGYGTHRLATHLRSAGYTCLVVDFMSALDYDTYKQILDYAIGPNTLMVGVSVSWLPYRLPNQGVQTHDPGREVVDERDQYFNLEHPLFGNKMTTALANGLGDQWLAYVKEKNKKTKIVLGGSKIDMYMDIHLADYIIIGLGETMTLDLVNSLKGKQPKRLFNRIIDYDQKAQSPVWDFRDSTTEYTDWDFIQPQEALSLEVGRGCRFKCKYCSYPLIGQRNINDYLKHAEVLRSELLNNYNKHRTTRYYITDDTFNDSTEKLQMFLDVLKSLPFKINFWCYLRLDLLAAHPEQISILKEMGLAQCYFGIETFNKDTAKSIGKGMSSDRLKDTLKLCKEIWKDQVNIQAGFIVGLPYETRSSVMDTARWLAKDDCPIDIKWIFPLNIAGNHALTKYVYKSEFDKNSEKYGYYFPNPERFWEWAKDDETDIASSLEAEEVAIEAESFYKNKLYRGDFYRASLNHPVLSNRDLTLSMSDDEYQTLISSIDQEKFFVESINEEYFKPLLLKLKSL